MQIVFLTARPELLAETLVHVRHYMPFVDQVVVVTPEVLADRVAAIPDVVVLSDEQVTGATTPEIAAWDHTSRNFRIRAAMARHDAIDDRFVMADDDNRPLQPVDQSLFFTADNRYRSYWFTELDAWRRDETPFDQGLTHALLALRQLGADRPLAYASHMPQLIDRRLFADATSAVADAAERYPLDEWSIYFNHARQVAPDRFAPPEPFVTLGWPRFPAEWAQVVPPTQFLFENHHPDLYQPNGLFAGLSTQLRPDTADADNLEKAVRWHRFGLAVSRLDIPADIDNPYTQGRRSRRAFLAGTRALKKVVDYATIAERDAVADLTGRIRRLEARLDEHIDDRGANDGD